MTQHGIRSLIPKTQAILVIEVRLSIALALFKEGSFADVNHTVLAAYAHSDITYDGCIGVILFIPLLLDRIFPTSHGVPESFKPCLRAHWVQKSGVNHNRDWKSIAMHEIVASYFWLFSGDPFGPSVARLENAFSVAALLANDVMVTNDISGSLCIEYAMGTTDQQVP
jgi:hypothetical protein